MREGWSLEKLQNLKTWNMLRNLKHALEDLCVITTRPWVEMVSMLHLKSPFLSLALEMLLINFPLYPLSLLFHLIPCPIFHPKSSFKLQLDAMQPCPHWICLYKHYNSLWRSTHTSGCFHIYIDQWINILTKTLWGVVISVLWVRKLRLREILSYLSHPRMRNPGFKRSFLVLNLIFLLYHSGCLLDGICRGFCRNSVTITIQTVTFLKGKNHNYAGTTGINFSQPGKLGIVILTKVGKVQGVV